ncbi:MAG: 8-oxo-dGTP diphosphatase MutT, partial [Chromatocurvus sp.]
MQHLRVAVGVVVSREGRILIARRSAHRHQGGLWEFPGGKVEAGETARQALAREMHEEVGIRVLAATAMLELRFDYPDRSVTLEVFRVDDYSGEASGREGQPMRWVLQSELGDYAFPE